MSEAVVASAYGGPEVLSVIDVTVPDPGPGQVRLAVRAAGVNPFDQKMYSGVFGTDPANLPMRLGVEAAGVVTAVGADATGPAGPVEVGDEVIAYRAPGAYAAELVVPASSVVPKPAGLSWEQAGGLMVVGVTAVHVLEAIGLRKDESVLIHGAAGGVGLMAVQLAAARGATVLGTASPARHDLLRDLGAIPIAYGPGLADRVRAAAPEGVQAAADLVGTDEAVDVSVELVADRSRIATIAGFGRGAQAGIKLLGGGPGADPGTDVRAAARLQLTEAAEAGRLRVLIAGSHPLGEAAAAHRQIMTGHTSGKIVLVP
ncbi:quinone oxidoreductase family protein [Streptomyces europaeiscabiei]|uniref:NADP-dependent oxidoreductase n=1 Tax=Streptomyces europaeiscabiei TaxID=146819 RepID=A0ABU4NDL1_9ACTN|nr:NADP-dependent oxidoreductase [Streptomyces europaeiscabiei]MDX2529772.1 NADP-dependent oxidoreductase [Streptomyces europaeiscabiei]MDX2756918.1 NADP-dependent oxidoreductase [Streptomyces europaeiscabiei]MDX2756999.1 NADP-dependent oxidoreductase [Streptomyces europaeiscabiei]MDX2766694.1 NADP-dependent oxidoreductase [Streptomyces europaeiscabiei]MDX3544180.1 NADP-dependent oxidoreductase [Streptomyces europaeiscabiei]